MCENLVEINLRKVINFKKCGEILIAPDQFQFVCKFCQRFFSNANAFMRHILNGSHEEELDIPLLQSTVDVYSVEELIDGENSQCIQSVESELSDVDDVNVECVQENEILDEDEDASDAQSVDNYQLEMIEVNELPFSAEEEEQQQSFDDRESGCCSFETPTQQIESLQTERQDVDNDLFENLIAQTDSAIASLDDVTTFGVETPQPTANMDDGYDSLKTMTRDFIGFINNSNDSLLTEMGQLFAAEEQKSMEVRRQAKNVLDKFDNLEASTSKPTKKAITTEFDDKNDEENKENTPPKWPIEAFTILPLDAVDWMRSKSQRLPEKTAAKSERPRLIRMPAAPLQKQTDNRQFGMPSNVGPVKRKSDIGIKDDLQYQKRQCDGIASTLSTETPVNGMKENLNDNSNEMLQRGEVLARMRHIKKQIFQALQPNKRTCGTLLNKELSNAKAKGKNAKELPNIQIMDIQTLPNLKMNGTTDTIKSFYLQGSEMFASTPASVQLESCELNNEQSTLDLISETANMDSIQLDVHKLASDSNMEGISLLDASAISLPEQVDLDGSLAASPSSTTKAQNTTLIDMGDEQLLAKVGLRCIRMSTLDNTLTLAEEEAVHARARIFAEALRVYESIWCHTTINGNTEEAFSALVARLNERLDINLNIIDLKQIVNELLVWYKIIHQQRLINKKRPPKFLHFYLNAFAFLPKTTRYTLYCEHCAAKFRFRRDYRQHKQREHNHSDSGNSIVLTTSSSPPPPTRPERGNICAVCEVICTTAEQLYEHSITHLEQVHACALCARVFATVNDLQSHTQISHHEKRPQ